MKKDPDLKVMGLNPETALLLKRIREQKESGEELDPQTLEALKAIDIAGKVVNTIMSGNQIDPVFFKHFSDMTQHKMKVLSGVGNEKPKKVRKKRKFKRKEK